MAIAGEDSVIWADGISEAEAGTSAGASGVAICGAAVVWDASVADGVWAMCGAVVVGFMKRCAAGWVVVGWAGAPATRWLVLRFLALARRRGVAAGSTTRATFKPSLVVVVIVGCSAWCWACWGWSSGAGAMGVAAS
jgi:hypothetical protein